MRKWVFIGLNILDSAAQYVCTNYILWIGGRGCMNKKGNRQRDRERRMNDVYKECYR